MKKLYYHLSIVHSRLASHFASEKSFGAERFALAHEIARIYPTISLWIQM